MTTISLSVTDALPDLMPGRAAPRKAPIAVAAAVAIPALRPVESAPLRLLPRALRDALVRRIRQRELEAAFARLTETSPHLLADVGMVAAGAGAAKMPALSAPEDVPNRAALPRERRRLLELDDRLLRDAGITRAQARAEARRPAWNAPDHWLR